MRHITVQVLSDNSLRAEFSSRLTGRKFSATINKKHRLHIRRQDSEVSDPGTDKIITHCEHVGGMLQQNWVRYPVDVSGDLRSTIESFRGAIDRFVLEHEWMDAGRISESWTKAATVAGARLHLIPRNKQEREVSAQP